MAANAPAIITSSVRNVRLAPTPIAPGDSKRARSDFSPGMIRLRWFQPATSRPRKNAVLISSSRP